MRRQGFTIIEIIIVIIIVGIVAAFALPNFTASSEQARSLNAQNNLLAIFSAEKNYNNTHGNFISLASLALINSTLSLNIQDDGIYAYSCSTADPSLLSCTAQRSGGALTITVTNTPFQSSGSVAPNCSASLNPTCCGTSINWCPN